MASSNPGQRRFIVAGDAPPILDHGIATRYMRSQNTMVAWSDVANAPATLRQDTAEEILVILPDAGALLSAHGAKAEAPARSIAIMPAGSTAIELTAPGRVIRTFSPVPPTLAANAINSGDYAAPRQGVNPIGAPLGYSGESGIRVYAVDQFMVAAGKRPPSFQTATMNIMWIEQNGAHDPAKLNPHAHDDFEEGALVVDGDYIQHLRTPWTNDAAQWREDEHVTCRPGTLIIVPPTVIHATGALGAGRHLMLNLFAPARADHIKSGMVLNAQDYMLA
jgi:mannose-6-phosphate isomerase-like protein (cupin superfamily)